MESGVQSGTHSLIGVVPDQDYQGREYNQTKPNRLPATRQWGSRQWHRL